MVISLKRVGKLNLVQGGNIQNMILLRPNIAKIVYV